MLQQYSHNFDGALASLDKASLADPTSPDPMAWRAAIQMVQANYAKAQAECDALKPLTTPLFAAGCTPIHPRHPRVNCKALLTR